MLKTLTILTAFLFLLNISQTTYGQTQAELDSLLRQVFEERPFPKITRGVFPFRLVYVISGDTITISDALVCKYDRTVISAFGEKKPLWKSYLKSGKENIILLEETNGLTILYDVHHPRFYLGILDEGVTYNHVFPNAHYNLRTDRSLRSGIIDASELLEKYDIELISWEPSPPLEDQY